MNEIRKEIRRKLYEAGMIECDEYDELYEKLVDIEINEVHKSAITNTPVSEYGNIIADIVTYMGNQFIEGGKRYM